MARPRKRLPANGLEIIREGAANGLPETQLARALGMCWDTWKRIRDEDPVVQRVWSEAKAVEHDELKGMIRSMADGAPAEYDDKGNCIRAEIPANVRLRALELLVKCRHGWREQGNASNDGDMRTGQLIMPVQMSVDQLRVYFPNAFPPALEPPR